jgi:hypothetical protein
MKVTFSSMSYVCELQMKINYLGPSYIRPINDSFNNTFIHGCYIMLSILQSHVLVLNIFFLTKQKYNPRIIYSLLKILLLVNIHDKSNN